MTKSYGMLSHGTTLFGMLYMQSSPAKYLCEKCGYSCASTSTPGCVRAPPAVVPAPLPVGAVVTGSGRQTQQQQQQRVGVTGPLSLWTCRQPSQHQFSLLVTSFTQSLHLCCNYHAQLTQFSCPTPFTQSSPFLLSLPCLPSTFLLRLAVCRALPLPTLLLRPLPLPLLPRRCVRSLVALRRETWIKSNIGWLSLPCCLLNFLVFLPKTSMGVEYFF